MWFWKSRTEKRLQALLVRVADIQLYVRQIDHKLAQLDQAVQDILLKLKPGKVVVAITGEDAMSDKILFNVILPEPSAADVVARKLTVTVGDDSQGYELTADSRLVEGLSGDQDATVVVSLVDVDDAGNESEARVVEAVLTDTFAPGQPGELSIATTGEVHAEDEPAVEEPAVDEPVVDEGETEDDGN